MDKKNMFPDNSGLRSVLIENMNSFQSEIAVVGNYDLEIEAMVLYALLALVNVDEDVDTAVYNQDTYLKQLAEDLILFTKTTHYGKDMLALTLSVKQIYNDLGATKELELLMEINENETLYITEELKGIFGTHEDAICKTVPQVKEQEELLERFDFYREMFKHICKSKYNGEEFDIRAAGRFLIRFMSDDSYEIPYTFFNQNDPIALIPHIKPPAQLFDKSIDQEFYTLNNKFLKEVK